MSKKFQLQIPEACEEGWDKMTPLELATTIFDFQIPQVTAGSYVLQIKKLAKTIQKRSSFNNKYFYLGIFCCK